MTYSARLAALMETNSYKCYKVPEVNCVVLCTPEFRGDGEADQENGGPAGDPDGHAQGEAEGGGR